MRQPRHARRDARRFGMMAEAVALIWLVLKGYRILARHVVIKGGEIDLIVAKSGTIAFVEVKARPDMDQAAYAITAQKRARIAKAARVWVTRNRAAQGRSLRGDAMFIAPWVWPRHVQNAFGLEG